MEETNSTRVSLGELRSDINVVAKNNITDVRSTILK